MECKDLLQRAEEAEQKLKNTQRVLTEMYDLLYGYDPLPENLVRGTDALQMSKAVKKILVRRLTDLSKLEQDSGMKTLCFGSTIAGKLKDIRSFSTLTISHH